MKKRNGFVTNSSSSSYICEVCGNVEAGMDIGLRDAEMYRCVECGMDFCYDHGVNTDLQDDPASLAKACTYLLDAGVAPGSSEWQVAMRIMEIYSLAIGKELGAPFSYGEFNSEDFEDLFEETNISVPNQENLEQNEVESAREDLVMSVMESLQTGRSLRFSDSSNTIPSFFCPICNLKHISDNDLTHYLLHRFGLSLQEAEQEIKDKFTSRKEMLKSLEKT